MDTFKFAKSQELYQKASKVIPSGLYGHFSPAPLIPATDYPFYISHAKGAKFWDVDGNEFIDYMCAYGPMVLGYNNPAVDDYARKQYELSDTTTVASPVMIELAEELVDMVTIADWAFFAKNGNDVTTYAVMVARAATDRKKIVKIAGGYHGTAPWTQSRDHHGIIPEDDEHMITIHWNNYEEFEKAVNENPKQIAGFIASPYHHPTFVDNELPAEGYWKKVEALCKKEGIVLIVDDVRAGFRLDLAGSNEYFGFKPDLICFCKAIGNGYPISALVGTEALKTTVSKVFYTGSFWFSAVPMAASLATLREMRRVNSAKIVLEQGKKLLDGLVEVAKSHKYDLKVTGMASMPYLRLTNDPSLMLHQDWCAECTKRGAYFTSHHNWFLSTAHSDDVIKKTLEIADDAFVALRKKYGDRF